MTATVLALLGFRADLCVSCGQPRAAHRVNGRWVGCTRDIVLGQDQARAARRLRLALIQSRVLTVYPFGIGGER